LTLQKIELELDEQTVERARHLAELRHTTLEEWLKTMINQMVVAWSSTTSTNWEQEKKFIRQRMAKGPLPTSDRRTWTREEIYDARLSG
jgi:hypothetical protein